MNHNQATAIVVARVMAQALVSAKRDIPRFGAGDLIWVKVKACERLIRRGLGPTVWREGLVVQSMDGGRVDQVSVLGDAALTLIVRPSDLRFNPPWKAEPRAIDP